MKLFLIFNLIMDKNQETINLQKEKLIIDINSAEIDMKLCITVSNLARLERLQKKNKQDILLKRNIIQEQTTKYNTLNSKKQCLISIVINILHSYINSKNLIFKNEKTLIRNKAFSDDSLLKTNFYNNINTKINEYNSYTKNTFNSNKYGFCVSTFLNFLKKYELIIFRFPNIEFTEKKTNSHSKIKNRQLTILEILEKNKKEFNFIKCFCETKKKNFLKQMDISQKKKNELILKLKEINDKIIQLKHKIKDLQKSKKNCQDLVKSAHIGVEIAENEVVLNSLQEELDSNNKKLVKYNDDIGYFDNNECRKIFMQLSDYYHQIYNILIKVDEYLEETSKTKDKLIQINKTQETLAKNISESIQTVVGSNFKINYTSKFIIDNEQIERNKLNNIIILHNFTTDEYCELFKYLEFDILENTKKNLESKHSIKQKKKKNTITEEKLRQNEYKRITNLKFQLYKTIGDSLKSIIDVYNSDSENNYFRSFDEVTTFCEELENSIDEEEFINLTENIIPNLQKKSQVFDKEKETLIKEFENLKEEQIFHKKLVDEINSKIKYENLKTQII